MRWSKALLKTLREAPSDATEPSHVLMARTNMMHQVSPGIYNILPFGKRALDNVERIIREEMNRIGAQEIEMPTVIPEALWRETGRWDRYGDTMMRVTDRKGVRHGLGPTHEEPVTDIARVYAKSHRDLPLILYQITPKFRDEVRPRAGVLRGREFGMKDAYSFDKDEEGMRESFRLMDVAYTRIFQRLGLDFVSVRADSGAIGGDNSVEFLALTERGDVTFLKCNGCDYRANVEKAHGRIEPQNYEGNVPPLEVVDTPNLKTVDDLVNGMPKLGHDIPAERMIKTILYQTDEPGNPVIAAEVLGSDDINEVKLANAVGCGEVSPASHDTVVRVTDAPVGFAGPINLPLEVRIYIDDRAARTKDVLFGVNQADKHAIHGDPERDILVRSNTCVADIRSAKEGDGCPSCDYGALLLKRGIELGHIFQLGTVYSTPMSATFTAHEGDLKPYQMGCYGIGTTRLVATIIEQNHDEDGIMWTKESTPYHVVITPTDMSDELIRSAAERVYEALQGAGFAVLYDDRAELRPGVKFKDADLVGVPLRITIGKKYKAEGLFELRDRRTKEVETFGSVDEVLTLLKSFYEKKG